jgi:hypothetical protein
MPRLTEVFKIREDVSPDMEDVLPIATDMEEAEARKLATDNGWDIIPGPAPGVFSKKHWKLMQGMSYEDPDKIPATVVAAGHGRNPMSAMLMARSDAAKKLAALVHQHRDELPESVPNIWETWEKLQDATRQELGVQDLESLTPGGGALSWDDEDQGEVGDDWEMSRKNYIAAKAQGRDPWAAHRARGGNKPEDEED